MLKQFKKALHGTPTNGLKKELIHDKIVPHENTLCNLINHESGIEHRIKIILISLSRWQDHYSRQEKQQ